MAQSGAKVMMSELHHDDPCTSSEPSCQSETSTCMMDCCMMTALYPVTIHFDHYSCAQWIRTAALAAIDPKASLRPPII
ncbi:MAG: hypothetical protein N4A65_04375 [Cohaesibacter sp.]|nr:hypothetical protein [Cohaesibacter sp.]